MLSKMNVDKTLNFKIPFRHAVIREAKIPCSFSFFQQLSNSLEDPPAVRDTAQLCYFFNPQFWGGIKPLLQVGSASANEILSICIEVGQFTLITNIFAGTLQNAAS